MPKRRINYIVCLQNDPTPLYAVGDNSITPDPLEAAKWDHPKCDGLLDCLLTARRYFPKAKVVQLNISFSIKDVKL